MGDIFDVEKKKLLERGNVKKKIGIKYTSVSVSINEDFLNKIV